MRTFNYSAIREQKWDSDVLGLIAAMTFCASTPSMTATEE